MATSDSNSQPAPNDRSIPAPGSNGADGTFDHPQQERRGALAGEETAVETGLKSGIETEAGSQVESRVVTWAGLLARWMEFARSAVALPDDDAGRRWKASVVPIVSLHALSMALGEIELLDEVDRPFARDRAAVAIADAAHALREAWHGEAMPDSIVDLRDDAVAALERAKYAGATELRWNGPGVLDMPAVELSVASEGGDALVTLCVAAPGTPMMPGEPVAWWTGGRGVAIEGCAAVRVGVPRQVYRVLDPSGIAVRDLVVPITDELPAGMPLLVPLMEEGRPVGRMPADVDAWRRLQWSALPDGGVPVEVR